MIRLDKFISDACAKTRKEAKALIKSGRVCVDGHIVTSSDHRIGEDANVTLDGKKISYEKFVYIVMNKPKGVVCAAKDKNAGTVFDVLPRELVRKGLFTVGRLDKDTTGLLIITNDGELSHSLLSPSKHIEKEYYAEGSGKLCENAEELFREGMSLGELKLRPGRLRVLFSDETQAKVMVTISEGKYHQVKRMLYEVGITVTTLKRTRFGALSLDPLLAEGSARPMTAEEVELLSCSRNI